MRINPAELTILHYPAPVLRDRARAVPKVDAQVRAVAQRMIELMQEAEGVGLAAPQVGLPWRLFVTDVPEENEVKVYVNPAIAKSGGETTAAEEGCLSLPGIHVQVSRPKSIELTATDLDGNKITVSSHAFAARVWQHELDHLNGVLIIDRLSPDERQALRAELKMKAALRQ